MDLSLAEELILLAYEPDGKTTYGTGVLHTGPAGALLAELALRGRISHEDGRVRVSDPTPTGHPELDRTLDEIHRADKARDAQGWIQHLAGQKLFDRLMAGLNQRGILGAEPRKWLGITWWTHHPELDPGPETRTRSRLDAVVEGSGDRTDQHAVVLAALADACGMSKKLFPELDRKELKARMKELSDGEWGAKAVRDAITAAESTATFLATTIAVSAAVSSASN